MSITVVIRARARPAWHALREALEAIDYLVPCGTAPEIWSPDTTTPEALEYAERRCLRCPVLQQCGTYADAAGERGAVWGGTYRPSKPTTR